MPAEHHHRVALIIGASRGIGRQIALTLSAAGYAVVVSGKFTADDPSAPFPPDPNSPASTAGTVAREVTQRGGTATAAHVDTRSEASVAGLVKATLETYGRLDALVYNAGAIWWSSVSRTPFARYALMRAVNLDGFYAALQAALPVFDAQGAGRIVAVCPPIYSRFFRGKAAYAAGKVGMSVLVKGLATDFGREGRKDTAVTGIWPATTIQSGATREAAYVHEMRNADIFGDAVREMLAAPAEAVNGLLTTDEDFLREQCGWTEFGKYSAVPGARPRRIMPAEFPDLRVAEEDDEGRRADSVEMRKQRSAKL